MITDTYTISEQNIQPVDFNEIIRQSVEQHRYTEGIDQMNFNIKVEMKAPFGGNRKLIEVVFNSLISNGIKYRKITGDQSTLFLNVFSDDQKAIITIKDNGKGISENDIEKIFQLFQPGKQRELGQGIGLYMTKEIIEKLGGSIAVESTLHVGTVFTIEIPNLLKEANKPITSFFE